MKDVDGMFNIMNNLDDGASGVQGGGNADAGEPATTETTPSRAHQKPPKARVRHNRTTKPDI